MAVIKKDGGYMPLPLGIKRGNPIPLDTTSIWYSLDLLQVYARGIADELKQYNLTPTAYVGQIVTYVNEAENTSTVYVIADTAGTLLEVGSGAGEAVNVDNNTVVLDETGLLTLKDFGVKYYRYVAAQINEETGEEIPATYTLQVVDDEHPWKSGLIPQVVVDPEDPTNFIIGWYEPNPTTIEGVNTAVSALQDEVTAVKQNLSNNYYTKTELAGALKYKGAKADETAIRAITDANIGDVYVAQDTGIEYIWNGTTWDALGNVIDLSDYITKSEIGTLETNLGTLQTDVGTLKTDVGTLQSTQSTLLTDVGVLQTDVKNLEQVIGAPADTENNTAASGLYAVIAEEIANANYLRGVQIDGTDVTISNRKALLTSFSKESTAPGLVPVPALTLGENELKSDYFLNAEGNWAIPLDARIGSLEYNGVAYTDVTQYVEARVQNVTISWEPIATV